jgi:uncharacterized protein YjbI with pentapeptide repeats
VNIQKSILSFSSFIKTDFNGSLLSLSLMDNTNLSYANLSKVKARGVNFTGTNLEFANLSYSAFRRSVFNNSNMQNIKYRAANFYKSIFMNADLSTITFEDVYFKQGVFCKTRMKEKIINRDCRN